MKIYYFVNEAACPDDIRAAAGLRDEGYDVIFCNARLLTSKNNLQGVQSVLYSGLTLHQEANLKLICESANIPCGPINTIIFNQPSVQSTQSLPTKKRNSK